MNGSKSQLALREWRRDISSPVTWVALLGVAAILSLVGPFGTDRSLGLVQRFPYWLVTVALTYSAGALLNGLARRQLARTHVALTVGVAGVVTGLAVSTIVFVINWVVFDYIPDRGEWVPFLSTVLAISFIVTAVLHYASMRLAAASTTQDTGATENRPDAKATSVPLLDRLALAKRGPLVALSVEDHYVRVRTTVGEEMVLMRLSDAIREVGPTPGAQVHRSHWVAFGAVRAARREGDRAILTLQDGSEIPVSRANVPKIKEAGLLPR